MHSGARLCNISSAGQRMPRPCVREDRGYTRRDTLQRTHARRYGKRGATNPPARKTQRDRKPRGPL